jgi:hypothetical protein
MDFLKMLKLTRKFSLESFIKNYFEIEKQKRIIGNEPTGKKVKI